MRKSLFITILWFISIVFIEGQNSISLDGYTPLMLAIENNDSVQVRKLIAEGADVNLWEAKINPLIELANRGDYNELKIRANNGMQSCDSIHPTTILSNGYTPLMLAVRFGNKNLIQYLINMGADVNTPHARYNPLLVACRNNRPDIAKILIDAGADVNSSFIEIHFWSGTYEYDASKTPLLYAIQNRNYILAKLLLDQAADINAPKNGYSPLLCAIDTRQIEIIKLLIKQGVDVNQADTDSLYEVTPLALAARRFPESYDLLVKAGAKNAIIDANGKTAPVDALENNCTDLSTDLLNVRASKNNDDALIMALKLDQNTPLHLRFNIVKQLIEGGANVNKQVKDGTIYPLDLALPYPTIYNLLLGHGATHFYYDGLDNDDDDSN